MNVCIAFWSYFYQYHWLHSPHHLGKLEMVPRTKYLDFRIEIKRIFDTLFQIRYSNSNLQRILLTPGLLFVVTPSLLVEGILLFTEISANGARPLPLMDSPESLAVVPSLFKIALLLP